jgi:hypothetical protein
MKLPPGRHKYKCPKCGAMVGTDIKLSAMPQCENEAKHHNKRPVEMVPFKKEVPNEITDPSAD